MSLHAEDRAKGLFLAHAVSIERPVVSICVYDRRPSGNYNQFRCIIAYCFQLTRLSRHFYTQGLTVNSDACYK